MKHAKIIKIYSYKFTVPSLYPCPTFFFRCIRIRTRTCTIPAPRTRASLGERFPLKQVWKTCVLTMVGFFLRKRPWPIHMPDNFCCRGFLHLARVMLARTYCFILKWHRRIGEMLLSIILFELGDADFDFSVWILGHALSRWKEWNGLEGNAFMFVVVLGEGKIKEPWRMHIWALWSYIGLTYVGPFLA